MGGSLRNANPVIVAAFHTALRHQALIVVLLALIMMFAWSAARPGRYLHAMADRSPQFAEHPARRLLRISFGLIWILDGLLQVQPAMPVGLPTDVVQPSAATSPVWVQHVVTFGASTWVRHPIPAASAAVWIQIGAGALLLFSPPGRLSRLAGLVGVAWGLVVWVFGEAFGGIFAPGLSWMFGAPGAVLFYCVAGVLIALPDRAWLGNRLARILLSVLGIFFLGMSVLQAWPGRGFWQGHTTPRAATGALISMVQTMAQTPQPHALSSLLNSFVSFDAAHGWAVNLFVVVALALVGVAFLSGERRLVRSGMIFGTLLCLADWVFVQDLGLFGGLSTDPNSMIPLGLLCIAGYLALVREPAVATVAADASVPDPAAEATRSPALLRPGVSMGLGVTATLAGLGIVLVGAVPLASASVNHHTDAIIAEGINGQPDRLNSAASPIDLVDQTGAPVTLSSLQGRTIALTFLDPVCTTDCPVIAQEFRQVDQRLGPSTTDKTAFVAVVANPVYRSIQVVQEFDRQEDLDTLSNWYFLTGSAAQLKSVWNGYGVQVQTIGAGSMIGHADDAFVIDSSGKLRAVMGADPGSDSTTAASLATLLQQEMRAVMRS